MKHIGFRLLSTFAISFLLAVTSVSAQEPPVQSQPAGSTVPRLVKFSGLLRDNLGKPVTGSLAVTFALYQDQSGGVPLWTETQTVRPDAQGRYAVSLGATKAEGLTLDLFASGDARWLGVQLADEAEQPRVLLLSVPYALKAADAETVGGLPPSAFVLAAPPVANITASPTAVVTPTTVPAATPDLSGSGTTNFVPLWLDNSGTLGNSIVFQSTSSNLGIGTTTPTAKLDVKGGATVRGNLALPAIGAAGPGGGKNSQPLSMASASYNSGTSQSVNQTFRWQAEPVGNNTGTPSGSLNLLFASGSAPLAETGLNIASNGRINFAAGQTFPGTGTITGVTAGTDLTGGGSSGNVTLNLDTTQTDARYAQLGAANTFTQSQTVDGSFRANYLTADARSSYGDAFSSFSDGQFGSSSANLWAFSNGGGDLIDGFLWTGSMAQKVLEIVGNGQTTINTQGANYAASFTKESPVSPSTLAAMQVYNASTTGEAAWMLQGSTSNPNAVVKLVLPTGSTSNFLECNIPDGTRKCHITTAGTFVAGSDFAEALPARGQRELYEPGDVLVMSIDGKGVQKTTARYSRRVVGVYSTRPAVLGAEKGGVTRVDADDVPVAITGIVPTKVTAENGPVAVGDLLVTSSKPGYAMKATNPRQMLGAIVGKALDPLPRGNGSVRVLVILR